MAKDVVGLVLSSRAVFAAELKYRRGKRPVLKRVGMRELPNGAVRDGEVCDGNAVTKALVELWEEAGFVSKRVICGFGNQRTLVRNHVVPQMSQAQLSRALRYHVEDLLPVPVSDTILDFYPIAPVEGSVPPQMEGLLIAALKSSIESEAAAVANAGLKVVGVDLNSFAVLRSLDAGETLSGTRLVVSVGWRVSHIMVVRDRVPQFVRIVPLGVGHVLDALIVRGDENLRLAETFEDHLTAIRGGGPDQNENLMEAMEPILEQIRSTAEYYRAQFSGAEISSVLMLGYGVLAPRTSEAVTELLGIPVEIADPLQAVDASKTEPRELLDEIAPLLMMPIGLGMRGM